MIAAISRDGSCGGGHIYDLHKRSSLCGIEKRRRHIEHEIDFEGDDFLQWFKTNEPWICLTCLRAYHKRVPIASTVKPKTS